MRAKIMFIFILTTILIQGCQVVCESTSNAEEYKNLIGLEYESLHTLMLYGITDGARKNKTLDRYLVTEDSPIISAHYVIGRRILEIGSVFKIKDVMVCNHFYSPPSTLLVFDIPSEQLEPEIPIWVKCINRDCKSDSFIFDTDFFKPILKN